MKPTTCAILVAALLFAPDWAYGADPPLNLKWSDLEFDDSDRESIAVSRLPKRIRELHGKPVRIRGYILAADKARGIEEFPLVGKRENQPSDKLPRLRDLILIEMADGMTANYTIKPIEVTGRFEVHREIWAGQVISAFRIIADSVAIVRDQTSPLD
jgi:hypothetical protein